MLKDATYDEKFSLLADFVSVIILDLKRDLKNDHLKKDKSFAHKYFGNIAIPRLTNDELVDGYTKALEEKDADLYDFIATRWVLKNSDVYQYFEMHLRSIAPNFSELEELEPGQSKDLRDKAVAEFGASKAYIFSVLNSVVFPKDVFDDFSVQAKDELSKTKDQEKNEAEERDLKVLKTQHERELRRLNDKYEKKLSGMQRKYINDTESLKKQIRNLQKKLENGSA